MRPVSEIRLLMSAPDALDSQSAALFDTLKACGVAVLFAPPGTTWERSKELSAFDPTHVYVHSPPGTALANQVALRSSKARVFASCLGAQRHGSHYKTWRERAVLAVSRRGLAGVFTDTAIDREAMERLGFTPTQLPLAYDAERFFLQPEICRAQTRALLRIARPTLAYIGPITPDHGLHILIAALDQLREENWELLLPNFAPKESYGHRLMAQIAELGLRDKVVYFDPKPEELADHINAADIIVSPSAVTAPAHNSRLLRAAMGCGRVIIASDTPANSEALGGFGHLVFPSDPNALASRISVLLKQGPRLDLPAARWAKHNCTLMHQANALLAALQAHAVQKPRLDSQEPPYVA
jgi:glycosyltransferase involved in cell wall biosynthesis